MNTMQQEFDAVVAHLYAQNRPAKSADGEGCMYRGVNGLKCAVGCRIPDDKYNPDMDANIYLDGTDVRSLIKHFGSFLPEEIKVYEAMFLRLQYVHDTCRLDDNGNFQRHFLDGLLVTVAEDSGLTFEPQGA